jgi:hypothetical protein
MIDRDDAVPWTRPVFSVDGAVYAWDDVAAFARRHGGWDRLVGDVSEGVACQQAGLVPSPATVDREAKEFRYQRRLITAEETEAWLARRAIGVAQWMDHVRRTVLRVEHEAALPALTAAHPVSGDAVLSLAWVTGRCAGTLDDMAADLAQRVAAHVRVAGAPPQALDELDDALDRLGAVVVSTQAVETVITHRRVDWMLVEVDELRFDSEGAAREGALSLRHDGLSVAEVCDLAQARRHRHSGVLEELDGPLRTAVLGAGAGDVIGPVETSDGFVLARVESKAVPTIDVPEIHARAVNAVLARAIRREVEERVQWHDHG